LIHIKEFLTASKDTPYFFRLRFRHYHWLNWRNLIGERNQHFTKHCVIDEALARLLGYLEAAKDKSDALAGLYEAKRHWDNLEIDQLIFLC